MPDGSRRTLVLVRHAKAAWAPGHDDHERPLAERGVADAPFAGRWLLDQGLDPDVVLCSTALRTRQTLSGIASALPGLPEAQYERRIYNAHFSELVRVLSELPAGTGTAMLVGHQPGISELGAFLADEQSDPALLPLLGPSYPTLGVSVFEVHAPWAALDAATASLRAFAKPRA